MFLLTRPSDEQIDNIIAAQRAASLTYSFEGVTRNGSPPAGYAVDHNKVRLGAGQATFERAVAAMRRWEQFGFGWMRLCWPGAPIEAGAVVIVLASMPALYAVNACRIVYTVDEDDGRVRRFGFAYGTLGVHVARGEERFLVEWDRADDAVWYSILAFSRPKSLLAWLGYPVARLMQRRFAAASKRAMARAVNA
ncbi:MAG: DUF1990 domain-containing protein [Kouleothrix sp.]|nr:DUF1990 domain-containing protein [Kouleothrix sp.]